MPIAPKARIGSSRRIGLLFHPACTGACRPRRVEGVDAVGGVSRPRWVRSAGPPRLQRRMPRATRRSRMPRFSRDLYRPNPSDPQSSIRDAAAALGIPSRRALRRSTWPDLVRLSLEQVSCLRARSSLALAEGSRRLRPRLPPPIGATCGGCPPTRSGSTGNNRLLCPPRGLVESASSPTRPGTSARSTPSARFQP